jgi:hypothetical protein
MKVVFTIFLALSGLALSSFAQREVISGGMTFKGEIQGSEFKGPTFDLSVKEETIFISAKKSKLNFSVPAKDQSVADVVFSSKQKSVAVLLKSLEGRGQALATVLSNGDPKWYVYRTYEMLEGVDWIVELGAVSKDGSLILAKGAFMLPPSEDGRQYVNHRWMIFSIGENSLKMIESEGGLEKWAKINGKAGATHKK